MFVRKFVAHDFGIKQIANEVVAGIFLALLDNGNDVVLDGLEGDDSFFCGKVNALEHDPHEVTELFSVLRRKPAQLRNEGNGDVLSVLNAGVDKFGITDLVKEP